MNIILNSAFSRDDVLPSKQTPTSDNSAFFTLSHEQSEVIEFFLFFTDKKKNIIIDGLFSKILYSNQYFTMNGLYLKYARTSELFEAVDADRITYEDIPDTRKQLHGFFSNEGVHPISKDNGSMNQYEHLCNIEKRILELYSKTMIPIHEKKTPVYVFKNQLSSGYMKSNTPSHTKHSGFVRTPSPRQNLRTCFCVSKSGRGFSSKAESKAEEDDLLSKENRDSTPPLRNQNIEEENTVCVQYIKISGVWETELTYGITFKNISSRT